MRPRIPRYDTPLVFLDDEGNEMRRNMWRTPVHSRTSQCRTMTARSLWNLDTMVYYEKRSSCLVSASVSGKKKISRSQISRYCMIDPNFIEYMIGYPKDWTK